MAEFPTSRENSEGDLVAWARRRMTHYLTVMEEQGDVIGEIGVAQVRQRIEEMPRIADPHEERDGPESMLEGVDYEVTGSARENRVNIKVGWDLTQYRHGYPELQDQGFQGVVGMEALALARIAMATAARRAIENAKGRG